MAKIKLPAEDRKRLEDYQEDLDDLQEALDALSEAGMETPGLQAELDKIKKARAVILEKF